MCVCGRLGHTAPDTHGTKRPRGAENFLHRSLSMSTCMVKPHHWKHILPHHVTLWPELSWAAVFPMADSDTDSERCQTTALGWHSSRSYPDPATDPSHASLFGCVCVCQASVCLVHMHVCACQVCVSVQRQISRQQGSHKSPLQKAW